MRKKDIADERFIGLLHPQREQVVAEELAILGALFQRRG